jgi:hypothetical protein
MMAVGWTDSRNDIAYMLGGLGHVTRTSGGHMNDLWAFNMSLVRRSTLMHRLRSCIPTDTLKHS